MLFRNKTEEWVHVTVGDGDSLYIDVAEPEFRLYKILDIPMTRIIGDFLRVSVGVADISD